MEWYQVIGTVSQPLIGIASIFIAVLLYRLNCIQREDVWIRELGDFHRYFWTNPIFEEVRALIILDAAYNEVSPILKKRRQNKYITLLEYESLEKIDKFAALLVGYKRIEPPSKRQKEIASRLFDEYWLRKINHASREDLCWYISTFYPELKISLNSL